MPRFTRLSLGYPLRRLLVRSKKGSLLVLCDVDTDGDVVVLHEVLLVWFGSGEWWQGSTLSN